MMITDIIIGPRFREGPDDLTVTDEFGATGYESVLGSVGNPGS